MIMKKDIGSHCLALLTQNKNLEYVYVLWQNIFRDYIKSFKRINTIISTPI